MDYVSVLLSNGDGTFGYELPHFVGNFPRQATTADIDNDGFCDLLVSNRNSNDISVLINLGNGDFSYHGLETINILEFVYCRKAALEGPPYSPPNQPQ